MGLPGDMKEKVDPYLRPLYDAFYDFLVEQIQKKLKWEIEIAPLAFKEENFKEFFCYSWWSSKCQHSNKMFLTRIGENSKLVVNGDPSNRFN